jgi:Tfp pilus assembly protein PilF
MISNRVSKFFLAALPLFLVVSCSSPSAPPAATTQDKKAQLCTDLARFNTAVATLTSMSPSSTVGDFRKAREQVKTEFSTVKATAASVQDSKIGDLEKAEQDLEKAIAGVPNTATLQQAVTSVTPQVKAVQTAEATMKAGLNCP